MENNGHKYKNQCKAQVGHCPWCTRCENCGEIWINSVDRECSKKDN